MRSHRLSLIALACALGSSAALAQDVGFFRPAADPALTSTRPLPPPPPQPPAQPQTPAAPGSAANDTAQMAAAELAATRQEDALRWAEQQMDRAQQDAERAREQSLQAPTGVGAAFTGSTDERDR
jgi:hypothetical protein